MAQKVSGDWTVRTVSGGRYDKCSWTRVRLTDLGRKRTEEAGAVVRLARSTVVGRSSEGYNDAEMGQEGYSRL